MTNKTREKLREEIKEDVKKWWYTQPSSGFERFVGQSQLVDLITEIISPKLTQSNNRILRKWKKAIDKILYSYPLLDEFYRRMNEEYLKAKKEINK